MAIPLIDLAGDRLRVAAALGDACAEIGSFQIVGHLPGLDRAQHAPVSAGRHLMEKFQRTVGG